MQKTINNTKDIGKKEKKIGNKHIDKEKKNNRPKLLLVFVQIKTFQFFLKQGNRWYRSSEIRQIML